MRATGLRLAPWLVPAFLWAWLFFHLHYEWSLNPQYNYGWAVPVLAAFMFYLRWQARPVAAAATEEDGRLFFAQAMILALLLPVRVIEEANPDWRLLSWFFALAVVAYSLLSLAREGGLAWVRHFAFPVCFPLVAVPWLAQFENVVIQGMTRAVAFAAVEIAGWIGVGAYQIGNIIELHNGFVGVDEACSGVKTLQASIMVSLVLGELFQLGASKRFGLLIGGAIWVFVCNVLRATALVIIAAKQGTVALESWHDGIGTAVVIVGMAGLMAIAWFLRDEESGSDSQPPSLSTRDRGAQAPPTLRFSFFALAWLLAIFVATELWYRSHEHELVALPAWQARWPSEQPTFRDMPIADTTRSILRYDEATSAAWEDPRAIRWWTFFARWEPQRTALQLVRSHSPEICLPAIGRTFVQERPAIVVETDALPLRFRVYEFEQSDRPLFVFVCIQEDKIAAPSRAAAVSEWSAEGRVIAAWRGQRNLGQRLLEIAVIGFDDYLRAREAFAATVRGVVEKSAPTG